MTQGTGVARVHFIFDLGALQVGSASLDKVHDKARGAIESGEEKFRDAADEPILPPRRPARANSLGFAPRAVDYAVLQDLRNRGDAPSHAGSVNPGRRSLRTCSPQTL